ncbi:hypothetical protein EYC84_001033 [Monilinia fructicola]|uniref:Uncharacterized protein n=1 Tax=Monilinia fructicola TaxID=38448 RepID=A0A5M9JIS4_MONFR|nr:hypothetical protein EYC84_001033 [Monilinia fructicola]
MGLGSYLKAKKPEEDIEATASSSNEKQVPAMIPQTDIDAMELQPPITRFTSASSSRNSISNRSHVSSNFLEDIKHEVMVNYLYQQQCSHLWVSDGSGEIEGVLLRKSRNTYMACPPQLGSSSFAAACAALNVQCAMTVNSRVIKTFLQCSPNAVDVPLLNGLRIQILPTIEDLPRARKLQFAAFVASEALLVVWDDEALHLVQRAKAIESELMELVWKTDEEIEDERRVFFTLFFAQVIIGCLAQLFGPVQQMSINSKFYSANPPPRILDGNLPHITIQCPVYKEGLHSVIAPTVKSIKQAISTYELQGGSANMFINDDGLQIIDAEERQARIDFYADHSIGWVARPKHGDNFVRKGKFKKASNMNFGLHISCMVEEKLALIQRPLDWTQADEAQAYGRCLAEALEDNGRAWADGNIRIGDYILLIDSDTRVPEDCLLDACSEMEQSPDVGIMQFSSGVMQVVNTYFENGITFFTNLIYTAIRYTVSNGDVAPFVGHNAILRWAAIQQVSYVDEDGYEKFWSESHVSEDFDMSLRLQVNGYIIRLAAWAGEGFKEGVSLTVYDELARWEKYAYGCNELLFHPLRMWFYKGPFTPLFRSFLFSNIRFTSKVTIISYIGTYYAIGAAWILTTANYFAIGWYNGYLDKYYVDSWKVWFSIVIVFNGLGNIALAVMRYRIGERSLMYAIYENFKWTFMLAIFLGGLSLHVSQALLAHMFEIDMSWGSTSKEAEFILSTASFIPYDWRIQDFVAILPMATVTSSHLLLPLALNPALMTFSW